MHWHWQNLNTEWVERPQEYHFLHDGRPSWCPFGMGDLEVSIQPKEGGA